MIFAVVAVAMLAILPRLGHHGPAPAPSSLPAQPVVYSPAGLAPLARADLAKADSIVVFGLAQRGTPYVWAGTSPLTGFDCSGFIMYTFARFGVPVPHSTSLLIGVGRPVARAEAQSGDIVVFTGTDKASTTPGHAGIVISRRGELPLRFVHASSSRREPFVKVSQVENSDYERRFMQVRRVLGPGAGLVATTRARVPVAAPGNTFRPPIPMAALPARAVGVEPKITLPVPLPRVLAKRPVSQRVAASKPKARSHPGGVSATKLHGATAKMVHAKAATKPGKSHSPRVKNPPAKKKRVAAR